MKKGLQTLILLSKSNLFYARVTCNEWRVPSPRLSAWATQLLRRNVAAMVSQGVRLIAIEEVRNYRKFYTLKTFLKMASGRVHTSHPIPTPLDPPLTIHCRNHQNSLAYFCHLASSAETSTPLTPQAGGRS